MKDATLKVIDFVHANADALSLDERVQLYRAIATTSSARKLSEHFFLCADELQAASAKCRQLALDFKRSAS